MLEGNAAIPRCWVCRGARTACTSPLHQCWTRQCHCPPPALPWGCSSSPVHGFGTRACRAVTDPSTTAETWEEWVCWLQVVRHQLFDCSGYSKGCRYQLGCEVVVHLHPRAVKASGGLCPPSCLALSGPCKTCSGCPKARCPSATEQHGHHHHQDRQGRLVNHSTAHPSAPQLVPGQSRLLCTAPSEEQPKHSTAGAPTPTRLWSKMPQETLSGRVLCR